MYHDFQAQICSKHFLFFLKASTLWIFLTWTRVRTRSPARQASQTWTPDGGQILSHYTGWLLHPRRSTWNLKMMEKGRWFSSSTSIWHICSFWWCTTRSFIQNLALFKKKHPGSISIHPLIDSTIPPSWPDPPKTRLDPPRSKGITWLLSSRPAPSDHGVPLWLAEVVKCSTKKSMIRYNLPWLKDQYRHYSPPPRCGAGKTNSGKSFANHPSLRSHHPIRFFKILYN